MENTETLFVVHLNPIGKSKQVVKKAESVEEAVEFVKTRNKNSIYLKNETVDEFLLNDDRADGIYILKDKNNELVKVYKLESLVLTGYVYNAEYKIRKMTGEYELIPGYYGRL